MGNIQTELLLFMKAVWMGALLTFYYDQFLVLRKVIHHKTPAYVCEDLIYWITSGIYIIYELFRMNQGSIRWFFILGAGFGMIAYQVSLHSIYIKFMSTVLEYIVVHIKKLLYIVVKPIKNLKKQRNIEENETKKSFHNSKK